MEILSCLYGYLLGYLFLTANTNDTNIEGRVFTASNNSCSENFSGFLKEVTLSLDHWIISIKSTVDNTVDSIHEYYEHSTTEIGVICGKCASTFESAVVSLKDPEEIMSEFGFFIATQAEHAYGKSVLLAENTIETAFHYGAIFSQHMNDFVVVFGDLSKLLRECTVNVYETCLSWKANMTALVSNCAAKFIHELNGYVELFYDNPSKFLQHCFQNLSKVLGDIYRRTAVWLQNSIEVAHRYALEMYQESVTRLTVCYGDAWVHIHDSRHNMITAFGNLYRQSILIMSHLVDTVTEIDINCYVDITGFKRMVDDSLKTVQEFYQPTCKTFETSYIQVKTTTTSAYERTCQLVTQFNREWNCFMRFAIPVLKNELQSAMNVSAAIYNEWVPTLSDIDNFFVDEIGVDPRLRVIQEIILDIRAKASVIYAKLQAAYAKILALNTQNNRTLFVLVVFYTVFSIALCKLIIWTKRPIHVHPDPIDLEENRTGSVYEYDFTRAVGRSMYASLDLITRVNKVTGVRSMFAVKSVIKMAVPEPGWLYRLNPRNWFTGNKRLLEILGRESLKLKEFISLPFVAGYANARFARNKAFYFLNIPMGRTLGSLLAATGDFTAVSLKFLIGEIIHGIHSLHALGTDCGQMTAHSVLIGNDGHAYIMTTGMHVMSIPVERPSAELTPAMIAQDWVYFGYFLINLFLGSDAETTEDGRLNEEASNCLEKLDEKIRTFIKDLLSGKMSDDAILKHSFLKGIYLDAIGKKDEKGAMNMPPLKTRWAEKKKHVYNKTVTPFFMVNDLNLNDAFFTMDYALDDAQVDDAVRFMEGYGRYEVVSL